MSMIRCSGCGATFGGDRHGESTDFDQHDCPSVLPIEPGESFEDWKARSDAAKARGACQ